MITNNPGDECKQRMKIMCKTSDGFEISEEDLRLRGPGDFFGSRQHGLPPLKIADIVCDMELMSIAQKCARELLEKDPELCLPEHSGIKLDTIRLFDKAISYS